MFGLNTIANLLFNGTPMVTLLGATIYTKYILDDMPLVDNKPRFSKDRLLQFRFRFCD